MVLADQLAALRSIIDAFAMNCQRYYILSPFVTVDEILSRFRGKCPFRVYIKTKPRRYGMTVWALADAKSHYCGNMQVYLGKEHACHT